MKVVQVLPELHGGGVERGTLEIAQALASQGHESHVVSAGGVMVPELVAQGSRHHCCEVVAKSPRSLYGILQLRRLILQLRPDIVHVRSRIPAWVVEFAYKTLPQEKRPVRVSTFHGFHSVNSYSAIMTRGKRIIAVSKTIATHIQQAYGVADEKIEVIYRGVDPAYFDPRRSNRQAIDDLRAKWHLPDAQTPVLLMPGRFTRLKGHLLLVEALAGLLDHNWVLVFVGADAENSSYTQEIQTLARGCGLESRLRYHGPCSNMPLAYAASDLVLNVSTRPESFGRTAVEAMAMEKPVIVSGHGGALETIVDGDTGWYFAPNDQVQLRQILRRALVERKRWQSMGEQGRRHVGRQFTLREMCQKTLQLYTEISDS